MTRRDEELSMVSARESAGWNSPPSRKVWSVTPDLTGKYDVVYFEALDDAIDFIHDNIADRISSDYTEEELARDGFSLSLKQEFISKEQYDSLFLHDEIIDL